MPPTCVSFPKSTWSHWLWSWCNGIQAPRRPAAPLKWSLAFSGPYAAPNCEEAVNAEFGILPLSIPSGFLQLGILGIGNPVQIKEIQTHGLQGKECGGKEDLHMFLSFGSASLIVKCNWNHDMFITNPCAKQNFHVSWKSSNSHHYSNRRHKIMYNKYKMTNIERKAH